LNTLLFIHESFLHHFLPPSSLPSHPSALLIYVPLLFTAAVHHRATGCPDEFPRKLVRTTVSNDYLPTDVPFELQFQQTGVLQDQSNAAGAMYNLSRDRTPSTPAATAETSTKAEFVISHEVLPVEAHSEL
jgi:hypothetical protein